MGKTRPCKVCGTEVSIFRVPYHEKICTGIYPHKKTIQFEISSDGRRICPDCGEKFHKLGIATHWRTVHRGDPPPNKKGHLGWNRGLTVDTDERVKRNTGAARQGVIRWIGKMTPEERKEKFGKVPAVHNMGGIRHGSGRGRSGWYEGYWCDSSWELAWVIYAVDHSINFQRNDQPFVYEYLGNKFRFYPDFRLEDSSLVEIKGYLDPKNEAKISAVPNLKVIGKIEIQPFLDYAVAKFGRDFASMGYGKPPQYQCIDCSTSINRGYDRCHPCASIKNAKYKIEWPDSALLLAMATGRKYEHTARMLGVSSTAIRKRIKKYGLVAPM